MVIGPSGWTRTTTSRVKSPACCVDTTKGLELMPSIELGRRPYQSRMLPLHHISVGANGRTRTDAARLGRPACRRYTTFALLVRPTGIEPVPPRWHHGMLPPHPGRTDVGSSPTFRHPSVVKDLARFELVGSKGFEPPHRQALDLPPLPGLGYMAMVPPGGLEPPLHGLRARRAALTPRRGSGADPERHPARRRKVGVPL